ncbi:hypothetical protein EV648_108143 [Kribbella sp. VKM Ac-2568]|nr:hypothetical protein [Kribbella sp. VKM Ac-2568]TCM44272.1 hypothetical protein EV648_108143 [Kribbella sp. VKM Ac-2568]
MAASYPDDVARHFVRFRTAGGAEVVAMGSHGIFTAAEVGTLDTDEVVAMVRAADHPEAEAILVPDTAMHTHAIIEELEAAVDKPVPTANQVTVWRPTRPPRSGSRNTELWPKPSRPATRTSSTASSPHTWTTPSPA